ncbi:MAG TPA: NADH-dependent [FeFe] hydrogenase, group A6 [Stenomitos sp.]
MSETITLTLDGRSVSLPAGMTILDAARRAGIDIPTLCHHPDLSVRANCRLCVVEVEGRRTLVASCDTEAADGMVVRTNTPLVRKARQDNLGLILSDHPMECPTCVRNQTCELQELTYRVGATSFAPAEREVPWPLDSSGPSIVRDPNKCVLCRRCVEVCHEIQTVGAIGPARRGFETVIGPSHGYSLAQSSCVNCGQCINRCPVGALYEQDDTAKVWAALADPEKVVVAQIAPATRVSIGEELGFPVGTNLESKLPAALRSLGFHAVFDAVFTADLTIMEEGSELVERLTQGGKLPMMTSCCPGWVSFAETFYPEFLDRLSSCKSPQQMLGALAKTFYAQEAGIDPARMVVVSLMPCTAKKAEAQRPEMRSGGHRDVDVVLTTRELGRMLRQAGLRLDQLPDEPFDDPLGLGTGAGVIFGATGGVMEAALRTAHRLVTGRELDAIDVQPVRGLEGVRTATVDLDGTPVKVAVAHGLGQARALMEQIQAGTADYHFIEVMACPGGCVGGGGQPICAGQADYARRAAAIYAQDQGMERRRSHENPAVLELYSRFLAYPLGERSHQLLHTHYQPRVVATV